MAQDKADELIRQTEATRGYLNPGHQYMAHEDPDFLEAYNHIAAMALKHGDREQDSGDLSAGYRELIACVLLAFRGVPDASIAGHMKRALRLGVTEREAIGAFEAAFVPGGAPTLLTGMRVLGGIRSGEF